MSSLVWFRRDLRVRDHPAMRAAARGEGPVVPVFCFDDRLLHGRHRSPVRTQFLLESLRDLQVSLRELGSDLVIRRGDPATELAQLAADVGADTLHHSADAGPFARKRDERVAAALGEAGVEVHAHPGVFTVDMPGEVVTAQGRPYTVFSPYHRNWAQVPRRQVLERPHELSPLPQRLHRGEVPELKDLGLSGSVEDPMRGGESLARKRANHFVLGPIGGYGTGHNALGTAGTSGLSPYLHFGCISPREIEAKVINRFQDRGGAIPEGPGDFLRQLAWRDFYAQVILRFPANAFQEHQERYRGTLRWADPEDLFEAWKAGRTGYPLVDAGMRQLATEGWMHNRARLVVGSFLTKDLGIDWRWGERHFMHMLLDGDEANNNGNWQWIASVGVDPKPVFQRLFNPSLQLERFDPDGIYVRRYVPELAAVPAKYLKEPWSMPAEVQRSAGCVIGKDYPQPIVDHAQARREALERYARTGA